MDTMSFIPRNSTLSQERLYGTPQTRVGTGNEAVNVKQKSGGTGLRTVLQNTGSEFSDYSGLSIPALIALGFLAWYLFRIY